MNYLKTHSKPFIHYLRIMFVFAVFAVFAVQVSALSGCSLLRKPTSQSVKSEYKQTGIASFYADKFNSRKTASGEIFNNNLMTAAHKTLPFGTIVVVTNLHNGKSVKVKINDRGPFVKGRIIDLTKAAFAKIEKLGTGFTKVEIMVVD